MNDSIWATVLGVAKTFQVDVRYALYEISYENVVMYSKSLPSYDSQKDDAPLYDDSKDACNDIDLTDDEEIIVRAR